MRAIETLNAQDLVWSRDAATGTTQLKPIAQTFEKYATTLALTFSNGETVETTREHPFYVESEGFVNAGELGIGTSIVTRAGPSVRLVSVSSGAAQTVYNFEVADYHTYFVGQGEVWVHNANCGVQKIPNVDGKNYSDVVKELEEAGFVNRGRTEGGYEKWYHPDGSKIHIASDGRVIREPNKDAIEAAGKTGPGWRVSPDGDIVRPHEVPEEHLALDEGATSLW